MKKKTFLFKNCLIRFEKKKNSANKKRISLAPMLMLWKKANPKSEIIMKSIITRIKRERSVGILVAQSLET